MSINNKLVRFLHYKTFVIKVCKRAYRAEDCSGFDYFVVAAKGTKKLTYKDWYVITTAPWATLSKTP